MIAANAAAIASRTQLASLARAVFYGAVTYGVLADNSKTRMRPAALGGPLRRLLLVSRCPPRRSEAAGHLAWIEKGAIGAVAGFRPCGICRDSVRRTRPGCYADCAFDPLYPGQMRNRLAGDRGHVSQCETLKRSCNRPHSTHVLARDGNRGHLTRTASAAASTNRCRQLEGNSRLEATGSFGMMAAPGMPEPAIQAFPV